MWWAWSDPAGSEVDNVSAGRLYDPVRRAVDVPEPGRVLRAYSDEFTGSALDAAWTFVRPDPAVRVAGGALNWPVQGADLTGTGNDAGVLLRDAPPGNWIAETKLTLDLGEDTVRNYQQAGLIAYVDDDRFARLSTVAIWNTRQVEFGHEIPYAGALSYGGTIAGTPGSGPPGCGWRTGPTRTASTSTGPGSAGTGAPGPGAGCGPCRLAPPRGSA